MSLNPSTLVTYTRTSTLFDYLQVVTRNQQRGSSPRYQCVHSPSIMLFGNSYNKIISARAYKSENMGNGFHTKFELFWKDQKEIEQADKKEENVNQYKANTTRKQQQWSDNKNLSYKLASDRSIVDEKLTKKQDLKLITKLAHDFLYKLIFVSLTIELVMIQILGIVVRKIDRSLLCYKVYRCHEGTKKKKKKSSKNKSGSQS